MSNTILTCICALLSIKNILGQCYRPQPIESFVLYEPAVIAPQNVDLQRQILALPSPYFNIEADALVINGAVVVDGQLPFVSAVRLDGVVPTAGRGHVVHKCGVEGVGIVDEVPIRGTVRGHPNYIGPGILF